MQVSPTESHGAGAAPLASGGAWRVVGVVSIGAFMGQLDASIVSLVLPTLETQFHQSVAAVSWVAVSYLLTLATLVAVFGRLADLYGRKTLYTFGFVVFILGSAVCGAAPTLLFLIGARVFQGIGAGMLQANSVAIITGAVRRERLGQAIGIQGAAQALGLSLGPAVGGFLIASLGWRWVFYINVPAGILGAVLGWTVLPAMGGRREREPFDWMGAVLLAPGVISLMALLTFGSQLGWLSWQSGLLALAAVVFGLLFIRNQLDEPFPLVDLSLFRNDAFSSGIVAGLLSYTVLFGAFFIIPFYFERVRHHDPATTGLLLMPIPVALSVVAPAAGWLTDRVGPRLPTVVGMGMASVAFVILAFTHARTSYLVVGAALGLLGLGLGFFTPPNNSAIMGSAPHTRLGVAGGLLNMTRGMGTALGVAATGAVLGWQLAVLGRGAASTNVVSSHILALAFRHTLWFLAALSVLAALAAVRRGRGTVADRETVRRIEAAG